MLEVVEVHSERQRRQFLELARYVYAADPRWVPPVWLHYRVLMGGLRASDRRFYLALADGRPVARLGAKLHGEALHFGFFECLEGYPEAVPALVDQAHRRAPHLPMRGPYHFRQEDPYTGTLVHGFDREPCFMMAYNPPYYADYLAAAGLAPAQELLSYTLEREALRADLMESRAARARRDGIDLRLMDPWHRFRDARRMAEVFNQALADNWGFEPFEESHVRELVLLSFLVVECPFCALAMKGEQPVGALIMLPELGPVIRRHGGRLTPSFLWEFLRERRNPEGFRAYAIGVVPGQRSSHAAAVLVHHCLSNMHHYRARWAEISWVLADNVPMNALARALGGRHTRTHRLYERPAFS
ncbi:MAG: hypothetical protein AB1758_13750 [Candidatus Eremiobacterota bacterium]